MRNPINLPDVQCLTSPHHIAVNRVGITDLILPVFMLKKDGGNQHSVANISCYVDLEADKKGINMSRLPIGIHQFTDEVLNGSLIQKIADDIRKNSEATLCQLIYKFPYFIKKESPINKESGIVHYDVEFNTITTEELKTFSISITTIASTLCPCSKSMSEKNAHNQKCYIKINIECLDWVWIEDIIQVAEESASCEIYSILKRADEKYVTDKMYENPRFVEDVVREAHSRLIKMNNIKRFSVEAWADESIHMHKAYAKIEVK